MIFSQSLDDDEKLPPSVEEETFLHIMDKEFSKNDCNSWVAPLPFRTPRQRLPNNQEQALNFDKETWFMKKIFSNGHVEPVPTLKEHQEY